MFLYVNLSSGRLKEGDTSDAEQHPFRKRRFYCAAGRSRIKSYLLATSVSCGI
jgi:hypothetical protein